jgi:hypothetical protein
MYLKGLNDLEKILLRFKDEFDYFNIPFSLDILHLRKELIYYMHFQYSGKILGLFPRLRDFFCACGREKTLLFLHDEEYYEEEEAGVELDVSISRSDGDDNDDNEVIYVPLKDLFISMEDST